MDTKWLTGAMRAIFALISSAHVCETTMVVDFSSEMIMLWYMYLTPREEMQKEDETRP